MTRKKGLNITEIEDEIKRIVLLNNKETFIVDFLSFFDIPKTSITRANKKFIDGEDFVIKNKIFFREVDDNVIVAADSINQEIALQRSKPRYILCTDFTDVAAIDTKTNLTLSISFDELPSNVDFFLAWNGIEKADYQAESPADRKAAERFARLYDSVSKDNPDINEHAFNLFLIRVLFLLFSEDTGIIPKGLFTNTIKLRSSDDGSNLNNVIKEMFEILDMPTNLRTGKSEWLLNFPYVNGKLFGEAHIPLKFSKMSRKLLIEAGELLNWKEINPDILGAMIQSVASEEKRHVAGMHYTSVPNIMKVIKPLFLDELTQIYLNIHDKYEENEEKDILKKTKQDNKKEFLKDLNRLIDRISKIKIFDPACGSGNFLIIAYKELRRLEIKILLLIQELGIYRVMPMSSISLKNFVGIEIDDFAHEVAKLSLWIAEHQMNEEMIDQVPGCNVNFLPLKDAGDIHNENALTVSWEMILKKEEHDEVFIIGNPPYIGAKKQSKGQKSELKKALDNNPKYKKIDYIAAWFYLGAQFIDKHKKCKLSFVTTNSICQGEQVSMIWPSILEIAQISFAYTSFKWTNSAKNNAGVTVVIIGLASHESVIEKSIYTNEFKYNVTNISPYLVSGDNTIVSSVSKSISGLPKAFLGCLPLDGGNLILESHDYLNIIQEYPELNEILKKYIGSFELINQSQRYVFWMNKEQFNRFSSLEIVSERVNAVKKFRETGGQSARNSIETPYEFFTKKPREDAIKDNRRITSKEMKTIVIPRVSSENRMYVPMGIVGEDTVVSDSATAVYNAPLWLLGLLQSRMHMVWLNSIGGKLETRYRYSANLVYNTFPVIELSSYRKKEIERVITDILDLREYFGGTLAFLYDRNSMPKALLDKHKELDGIVDRAYQQRPFESDEERLSVLLKMYSEMTD